jgi:hypothetical protein
MSDESCMKVSARRSLLIASLGVLAVAVGGLPGVAQQSGTNWQTETMQPPSAQPKANPPLPPLPDPRAGSSLPNTTVVPRSSTGDSKPVAGGSGQGQVSLVALLTEDGQSIEQGLVWYVSREKAGPDGKAKLVATHREATPTVRLEPGNYIITVTFGRANLTRKIAVAGERALQERFVLNAGGLRLVSVLANGEAVNEKAVAFDIYSDERDQYGQRIRVMSAIKPGVIVRLNAGIYNVVGTYGDANAVARADVTVEAGKLTEATLSHAAAKVTFKLVTRAGGDAIADTQWNVATAQGESIKDSVGALPTHILAPGTYTVSAKHAGQVFQREFTVRAGDNAQVEVEKR